MYQRQVPSTEMNKQLAVYHSGTRMDWSQGLYTVCKLTPATATLRRESDGFERKFDRKTGLERDTTLPDYRRAYIIDVAEHLAREARKQKQADIQQAWAKINAKASNNDLAALEEAIAELKANV